MPENSRKPDNLVIGGELRENYYLENYNKLAIEPVRQKVQPIFNPILKKVFLKTDERISVFFRFFFLVIFEFQAEFLHIRILVLSHCNSSNNFYG